MLRDITLGQYYPADSVIHKLDPRVKLFSTMIYIISLFCFRGVAALAIATVFLITVIKLSKVPFKFMVKGLKAIMILMLITAVFNLFLTPGEALVSVWRFTITKEGVTSAVLMAIRLTYLTDSPAVGRHQHNGGKKPHPDRHFGVGSGVGRRHRAGRCGLAQRRAGCWQIHHAAAALRSHLQPAQRPVYHR